MADNNTYDPTSGDLHPELTQFTPPAGLEQWSAEAAGAIQDHVTTTAIADQAAEARNQFVNNVAGTKDHLVDMARSDPTSAPLALNLIDQFPTSMEGMKDHFRNQVAVATVQGFAALDHGAAHAAIDKYSDYLSDEDQAGLRSYTDNLELLRRHDNLGQLLDQRNAQNLNSDRTAGGYLSKLADPDTGMVRFPNGWGTSMMQDASMAPEAKASLFTAYKNLQTNGDPENSDPMAVAGLIKRAALGYQNPDHPTQPEVLSQVGGNISLADAGFISGRIGPQPQAARAQTQQLSDALDTARDQIGNPQAYSRFVNWFMPQARNGGNFDPGSKDYLLTPERMDRFMPTGDDIIAPAVQIANNGSRPSLGQIFGPKNPPPDATEADPNSPYSRRRNAAIDRAPIPRDAKRAMKGSQDFGESEMLGDTDPNTVAGAKALDAETKTQRLGDIPDRTEALQDRLWQQRKDRDQVEDWKKLGGQNYRQTNPLSEERDI